MRPNYSIDRLIVTVPERQLPQGSWPDHSVYTMRPLLRFSDDAARILPWPLELASGWTLRSLDTNSTETSHVIDRIPKGGTRETTHLFCMGFPRASCPHYIPRDVGGIRLDNDVSCHES